MMSAIDVLRTFEELLFAINLSKSQSKGYLHERRIEYRPLAEVVRTA